MLYSIYTYNTIHLAPYGYMLCIVFYHYQLFSIVNGLVTGILNYSTRHEDGFHKNIPSLHQSPYQYLLCPQLSSTVVMFLQDLFSLAHLIVWGEESPTRHQWEDPAIDDVPHSHCQEGAQDFLWECVVIDGGYDKHEVPQKYKKHHEEKADG